MDPKIKRRAALKAMTAIGGLLALRGLSFAQSNGGKASRLATGWLFQGQPCTILQQGSMLLLSNEISAIGSAVWTSNNSFMVVSGSGWDAGLTAQIDNRGQSIKWSNNTVWMQAGSPRQPRKLDGGWNFEGQPCAIFQQGNQLVLINEAGSIGCGLCAGNDTLTIIGGNGWDLGLTAQVNARGNMLNWSNQTIWTRA